MRLPCIDHHHQVAQQTGRLQSLHADETLHHLHAQGGQGFRPAVPQEVVERIVDGAGVVVRISEPVEIGQHAGASGVQFEIELTTAAELEQIKSDAPPGQEAALIDDALLVARVGKAVEPSVEVRKEVADGLYQGLAHIQGRPALRFWC